MTTLLLVLVVCIALGQACSDRQHESVWVDVLIFTLCLLGVLVAKHEHEESED